MLQLTQICVFLGRKVDAYWEEFPYGMVSVNEKQRDEVRGNLLILFRGSSHPSVVGAIDLMQPPFIGKLREGLLSTKRLDSFALEGSITSSLIWQS